MISLKKSFELQNYLKALFDEALSILSRVDNITICTQEHMRNKVYSEAKDETVVKAKCCDYSFSTNELIAFACVVQSEMEKLAIAINNAKHSNGKDFDSMITINNRKRQLFQKFLDMSNVKSKENITKGCSVKFNEEGNQVSYYYDIKETIKIDFDRNKVKAIANKLRKEIAATSEAIDLMQLETTVDFESQFEIGDSLEDCIEKLK